MWVGFSDGIGLHYRDEGPRDGLPVVFANSLGTDLRLWEPLLSHLPEGLRIIRYDKRGHGLSDCPAPPYSMGTLVRDAERILDHLDVTGCVFVGLSIGGMIGQGLAVKRPDLVRALVLSDTAAKIGTPEMWQERISTVETCGMAALADAVLERWFTRAFRDGAGVRIWHNMLLRQPPAGYAGCCAAIAGTDFYTPTSGLRLPVMGIAGTEDRATPPDLVRETVGLIPGARFELIRRTGHLPCVERPDAFAALLNEFLSRQALTGP
ncbi:3-oxoadipate enol-lactonase [Roseovarius sp. TE539]|uniref:3-oxoadipate enol-lactonase n=1 Tax=Roseovarius sp. TE539 TaxID=2249812 RepID=UPI000DE15A16|nr:3-oxoadipate enol-lactonase [Roseovarius sp. TE539]RBI69080.1 3-oxoadipate enol-lactonase [Roseovarius sp. TE539]